METFLKNNLGKILLGGIILVAATIIYFALKSN